MAQRQGQPGSPNGAMESKRNQDQQGQGQEGVLGQIRSAGGAVQSQTQHVVEEYPISTVLAVFGIGMGVGALLGASMFSSSSASSSSSNWWPSQSSSSSSWLPSMSSDSSSWWPTSSQSSSWLPASNSNQSWLGNSGSNWCDAMSRNAKSMCGY